MKKIGVLFLIFFVCFNFGGCMKKKDRISKWVGSEQDMSDQIMKEIISALDERDANVLKGQFSEEALGEATDLDQQIADLMDFYQGTMTDFSGHASSDTLTKYGEDIEKRFVGYYTLVTNKETYRVAYEYICIYKEDKDKEGLRSLELITQEFYENEINTVGPYQWQAPSKGFGVYMNQ